MDGIKYSSSVHERYVSYVLFADQSNVVGTSEHSRLEDSWRSFNRARHRWLKTEDFSARAGTDGHREALQG